MIVASASWRLSAGERYDVLIVAGILFRLHSYR